MSEDLINKLAESKLLSTTEECPGSIAAGGQNNHNLVMFTGSDKKLCMKGNCYFCYVDKEGVGHWITGFDQISSKSFIKGETEPEILKK